MTTALLIDDDANLRAGMRQMLSRYAPEITIIGEADSVQTGVEAMSQLQPQVLFLDIQLTDGTGFDLLEQLAEKNGKIKFYNDIYTRDPVLIEALNRPTYEGVLADDGLLNTLE